MVSTVPTADDAVVDNPEASRYELWIDDALVGLADYRRDDQVTVVPHVEVDPAFRGHGIGHRLVKAMLDDLRARDRQLQPLCPFVRTFVAENPDYADLVV